MKARKETFEKSWTYGEFSNLTKKSGIRPSDVADFLGVSLTSVAVWSRQKDKDLLMPKKYYKRINALERYLSFVDARGLQHGAEVAPNLLRVQMPSRTLCPFCAEDISSAAILCKHCKSDLAA